MIRYSAMFVLLVFSIVSDLKTSKIKNAYVLISSFAGISINTYSSGAEGFRLSAAGMVLPVILLWSFFYLRLVGAGDIKLFSAIGALVGWKEGLCIMAYSILAAGVVSIVKLSGSGEFVKGFRALGTELKLFICGRGKHIIDLGGSSRHFIKLSPSVAVGAGILLLTKFAL